MCAGGPENGRFFGVPKKFCLWVLGLFEILYLWVSIYGFLQNRGKMLKAPKKNNPPENHILSESGKQPTGYMQIADWGHASKQCRCVRSFAK